MALVKYICIFECLNYIIIILLNYINQIYKRTSYGTLVLIDSAFVPSRFKKYSSLLYTKFKNPIYKRLCTFNAKCNASLQLAFVNMKLLKNMHKFL